MIKGLGLTMSSKKRECQKRLLRRFPLPMPFLKELDRPRDFNQPQNVKSSINYLTKLHNLPVQKNDTWKTYYKARRIVF